MCRLSANIATPAREHLLHHIYLFLHRTLRSTRFVQKAGNGLLRAGTEPGGQTDARRRGRVEEEAHRHLGEAAMEERGQRQRPHPPGCCFLLSRLFRIKTLSWARACCNLRLAAVSFVQDVTYVFVKYVSVSCRNNLSYIIPHAVNK